MIDVGAMDSHNLEHQECDVRIKLYSHRLQQQWSNIQNPSKMVKGKNYYGNKNSRKIIMSGIYIHRKVKIPLSVHKITHISKSVDKGPQICWTILVERIVVVERILKASERRPPLGLGLSTEEPLIGIDCLFPTSNYRWRLLRPFADMFLGNMYSICHFLYFIKFFAIRAEITI